MNQLIRQIAYQTCSESGIADPNNPEYFMFDHSSLEKFTELIVKECDRVIKDSVSTMERGKLRASIAHAGTLIKEHFRVKE